MFRTAIDLLGTRKRLEGLALAILVAIVVFGFSAPRVLGMASTRQLERNTEPDRGIRVSDMVPGDSYSRILKFHNPERDAVDYQLVIVAQGGLWNCDSGNSLSYELERSPGADQHLEPGETEWVNLTVNFSLAAGNACQGKSGRLLIRRGFGAGKGYGGVYECKPFPLGPDEMRLFGIYDGLSGHVCWETDRLLGTLLH